MRPDHLQIEGPGGTLIDLALDWPAGEPRGWGLLLHPHPLHGGTRNNKVVTTLARTCVRAGWLSIRPDFRGVGLSTGVFDHGEGETQDMLHLWSALPQQLIALQGLPRLLAGFSFGAAVAARVHAQLESKPEAGLVLVGPAVSRFAVPEVPAASTLVIHGELDEVVPLAAVLDWARPQDLPVLVVPGADHFFHRRLTVLQDWVGPRLGNPALVPAVS